MEAIEFLKQKNLKDRILNNEDLPEYWVSISEIMGQYSQYRCEQIYKNTIRKLQSDLLDAKNYINDLQSDIQYINKNK